MKIRNGFVSNSSSSSFCMVGISTLDIKEGLEVFGLVRRKEKYWGLDADDERDDFYYWAPAKKLKDVTFIKEDEERYVSMVGIMLGDNFEKEGKTFSDLKNQLIEQMASVGVKINPKKVKLFIEPHYGSYA